MKKPSLQSLIIGFTLEQHTALVEDIRSTQAAIRLNESSIKPDVFDLLIKKTTVDVVFLRFNRNANFASLYQRLQDNNQDCIVIELLDVPSVAKQKIGLSADDLQRCQLVNEPRQREFQLVLKFVTQYVILKKDFRRCKSLLYLSEGRTLRLVDSSNHAIAFLSKGKFIHANIPFMVMFSAESLDELKRFSLTKLIAQDEREVFAEYISNVSKRPNHRADLVLNMRRITGAPFNAKIQVSPIVVNGERCYQLWAEQRTQVFSEESIPVTKALNIWDMPAAPLDKVALNPFDRIVSSTAKKGDENENKVEVLQQELLVDDLVKLRFRELYEQGNRALNAAWVKLDVEPDNFRKINELLSRSPNASSPLYAGFWDRLMFQLLLQTLGVEVVAKRKYLVTLSINTINDAQMMMWLYKQLKALGSKTSQLILVIDAEIPMNRIPQTHKVATLLRSTGCHIALSNFSVNTTPLFLFRQIKPAQVILDSQWIDELKAKKDDGLFIRRFVRKLEDFGVSVLIPRSQQKHQDQLFVLTSRSISQEILTKNCA